MCNLAGEREEYEMYLAFASIARKSPANPILVLWASKFDSDNGRAIKRKALIRELPSIQLGPEDMSQEKDFIIFIRDCGVVFGEVKRSATQVNIEKGEQQLEKAENFFQKVMRAISGPNEPLLPTSKLILIPREIGPSPATKTSSGCRLVYTDLEQNFQVKWEEVVDELKEANAANPINASDFQRLVEIVTGLWTMKPFQKKFFEFNTDEAALASNVQTVDKKIKEAFLSSKKGELFSGNVPTSSVAETAHRDEELNVIYFSPQQILIFDSFPHALIRAHSGCGKTLMILMKILDILERDPARKVLLVADTPHHLRCKNILERNNVKTEIISSILSMSIPLSCQVVIVEQQKFFGVQRNKLMSYDLSPFNMFFDDLHGYEVPHGDQFSNFIDIGDFIDYAYSVAEVNGNLCWFGLDSGQQMEYFRSSEENKVTGLFLLRDGSKRNFNVPVVIMDQILRNSKEIFDVLESAREKQAGSWNIDTSMLIQSIQCGHHIGSQKVLYHKLKKSDNSTLEYDDDDDYQRLEKDFVCARVKSLFDTLIPSSSSSSSSSSLSFDFSSVTILFESRADLAVYKKAVKQMLSTNFNLEVQTIEQQLRSNNHKRVLMDHAGNIQSFETAILVFVRVGQGRGYRAITMYSALSRARTMCMIVDSDIDHLPLPLENIDIVEWKESNGVFSIVN